MAPTEVMERLNRLKSASNPSGHITVTELARGKEWRQMLKKAGMMEVTDRGETAAWLVSQKDLEAIVYAVISLEQEVEDLSVAAMFESRAEGDSSEWKTGQQLTEDALVCLENEGQDLMAVVDERR